MLSCVLRILYLCYSDVRSIFCLCVCMFIVQSMHACMCLNYRRTHIQFVHWHSTVSMQFNAIQSNNFLLDQRMRAYTTRTNTSSFDCAAFACCILYASHKPYFSIGIVFVSQYSLPPHSIQRTHTHTNRGQSRLTTTNTVRQQRQNHHITKRSIRRLVRL